MSRCFAGIATLVLDALMSWMCALAGNNYVAQVRRCGFVLWIMQVRCLVLKLVGGDGQDSGAPFWPVPSFSASSGTIKCIMLAVQHRGAAHKSMPYRNTSVSQASKELVCASCLLLLRLRSFPSLHFQKHLL